MKDLGFTCRIWGLHAWKGLALLGGFGGLHAWKALGLLGDFGVCMHGRLWLCLEVLESACMEGFGFAWKDWGLHA